MPEVSSIYLRDGATGESIRAELWDGIEEQHLSHWSNVWRPALREALEGLKRAEVPSDRWPQNGHWDWRRKVTYVEGILGARTFGVVANGMTQGLMTVDLVRHFGRAPEQRGKSLVYVEFLETAPWNIRSLTGSSRFKGVGSALMSAAVALSLEEGFKGRLGLHSLPQADDFYRDTCGMSDFGKDPAYLNLRYFEMTAIQALAFIDEESES